MWKADGTALQMSERDYGIILPITVKDVTLGASDSVKFTFKTALNGETILEKTYDHITQNTINLEFTAAESEMFLPGTYVYSLDWYQDGNFLCNFIEAATFKVGDKA